jgi:hypothetical protein
VSDRKPLVLGDDLQFQQLQQTDNLDIPLEERVQTLQHNFRLLCEWLQAQGIELPDELQN